MPVVPGETGQLIVSLAAATALPTPTVTITVQYFNALGVFLGFGSLENIAPSLPLVTTSTWRAVYDVPLTVPALAATALILINALPAAGTFDVLVDDVQLILM